jgi:hypothetical protein
LHLRDEGLSHAMFIIGFPPPALDPEPPLPSVTPEPRIPELDGLPPELRERVLAELRHCEAETTRQSIYPPRDRLYGRRP